MHQRTEQEIMKNWKDNPGTPVVSICCPTYNHEPYIAEAIDSFLMQETNFPFEILIREDCSTDRTALIVKEYANQYPNLIKPIYEKENTYSKGVKPWAILFKRAIGKYIALCEGDDYWTDPLKLQKHVDFLEKNSDFIISGHDAFIIDENGKLICNSKLPDQMKKDFTGEELILGNAWMLAMSLVFRNKFLNEFPNEFRMVENGDTFFLSLIGHFGKGKYHPDIKPAAYRVHSGGVWSLKSEQEKNDMHINTLFWMYQYYNRIGEEQYAKHFLSIYLKLVLSRMKISFIVKTLVDKFKNKFIHRVLKKY